MSEGAVAAAPARGLWRLRDFNLLWGGQTVSMLGDHVSLVAFPLTAIVTLHATAAQLGLLSALGRLPFLLYLLAGAWVDRIRPRRVLVVTDLGRAGLLATIPLAAALHVLRIEMLDAIIVVEMTLMVWFDVASMTFLPSIVERHHLIEGNSRLEISRSAARIAGPSLGGVLVQAVTAPAAILVDCASFVVSAACVLTMRGGRRRPETTGAAAPPPPAARRRLATEVGEGLRFVFEQPLLRILAVSVCVGNLFWAVQMTVYLLFLDRGLGLPPATIGLVLAAAGPGALAGTLLASRLPRWIGLGPAVITALTIFGGFSLLIALVPPSPLAAVPLLGLASFMTALAFQISNVNMVTMRQLVVPGELLGRANATFRFAALGISPLGALAGGALGTTIGLRATLLVAAAGLLVSPPLLLLSPVRRLRRAEAVLRPARD